MGFTDRIADRIAGDNATGAPTSSTHTTTHTATRPTYPLVEHHTETRRSTATSEFWVLCVVNTLLLIAAYTDEAFNIEHAWTLVAIVSVGYLLSRGIAKAGSRETYVRSTDPGRSVDVR
ncbi:MAG TPA: hypothetical protein VM345_11255 [Acidimicrobiales bacterium]|jgi:hypothetical protein|nr:hypothetical protein [Acidimicrobiales bacterium]